MKHKYLFLFIVTFAFQVSYLYAQEETMMDEISNVYLEKLIATAKENNPRMSSFNSRTTIAKSNVTAQKSNWLDGLSFNYIYKPNNTLDIVNPTFFNGYQVAVSFTVTSLFQKSANVKQAKEALKIAQNDLAEYNISIESDVKKLYYTYIMHKKQLNLQYKTYADALNLNTDIFNKYKKGEVTFSEYLQAQTALNGAAQGRLSAELDFLTSKASLEQLTVKKLEEIK